MPQQELFMTATNREYTVQVVKSYDESYAREAFRHMDAGALGHLASSLKLASLYDESDIPNPGDEGYEDFIWDVMVEDAREDWKTYSYFVVTRSNGRTVEELFVSADWPTAESFVELLGFTESSVSSIQA